MFITRFHAMDLRDRVLGGTYFFEHKPILMKPWSQDMDVEEDETRSIPIWVQIRIGLKYWE